MSTKTPFQSITNTLLIVGLIAASGLIGHLWTKTKFLETPNPSVQAGQAGNPSAPPTASAKDLEPISDDDHIRGNRNARIALVEYSDLECPFCKQFHSTAQQVVDEYGDDVMWVYRHFPLDQLHPKARKEAEATECAFKLGGDDAFWALTDKIYENTPSNNGLVLDSLPDLASQVGLNQSAFQTCLDSGEMADHVESNYQSGVKAGVTGTPGNIILDTETGETQLLPGAVPFEQIKPIIDGMLAS